MKQNLPNRNKLFLSALLIFLSLSSVSSENVKNQDKELNKRLRVDDYYERPMIIPRTHYHHNDHINLNSNNMNFPQPEPSRHILQSIGNRHRNIYQPVEACPCINEVKCPPCGVVYEPTSMCPCAPKLNCPVCPPLSLIHEIAAKKAKEDQILSSNLIGLSNQISTLLTNITKYAIDVAKYELEAKNAARKMEESSLKAQFAKKKMIETSEKARIIAKSTLYTSPCIGCPPDRMRRIRQVNPMWYGTYNRIFPEEVSNVNKYVNANYNTNFNLNGNALLNQSEEIAKLSEGKINVLPLDVKSSSVNLSKRKKKIKL